MKDVNCKVKSLYKALSLLSYFGEEHKEAGITELAEYSGMLKSSVCNIMQTFEQCGYVVQNTETRKYMLGGEIISLFSKYKSTRSIDYQVIENLQHLRDQFKTSVYLMERGTKDTVVVCAEQITTGIADKSLKEGVRLPLYCTAAGKIFMGFSRIEDRIIMDDILLEKHTAHTITTKGEMERELEHVVYEGYATSNEEYKEKCFSVAVPVIVNGYADYAIEMIFSEPISAYLMKKYVSEMKYIGREIGSMLGVGRTRSNRSI